MKRTWIISLLLAAAFATTAIAAGRGPFDVRLTEPAPHVDLLAGSTASIAWDATYLPPDADEWEAFLSVNGGRTYPIRLTPHLDRSIRRFTFVVPSLPGAEATILLRFGDEETEFEFAFSARMQIKGAVRLDGLSVAQPGIASAPREEDDHGRTLVQWIAGSRRGAALQRFAAPLAPLLHSDRFSRPGQYRRFEAITHGPRRSDLTGGPPQGRDHTIPHAGRFRGPNVSPRSCDVLASSGRLNI